MNLYVEKRRLTDAWGVPLSQLGGEARPLFGCDLVETVIFPEILPANAASYTLTLAADASRSRVLATATGTSGAGGVLTFQLNTDTANFYAYATQTERPALLELVHTTGGDTLGDLYDEVRVYPRLAGDTPPAPISSYYTKTEADALLAGKMAEVSGGTAGQVLTRTADGKAWQDVQGGGGAVESVNGQTGIVVLDAEDVGAMEEVTGGTAGQVLTRTADGKAWQTPAAPPAAPVQSVNGKTGAVTLDAEGVGALAVAGSGVSTVTATGGTVSIPAEGGRIYLYNAVAGDIFTFATPASGLCPEFEIDIRQPAGGAVSITLPAGIVWRFGTPDLSTAGRLYQLRFRYLDGTWEGWTTPEMSELANRVIPADTIPTAGETYADKVYLYTGTTSGSAKHGHLYQCKLIGGTYSWIDVQTGLYGVGNLSGIKCFIIGSTVTLKWSDPEDTKIGDVTIAKWGKTVLVRKTGGYPASVDDGTVLVSSTVRDAYKTTPFNEPLPSGETYYYRWFIFTDDGVLNDNAVNEAVTGVLTWVSILDMCRDPSIDMRDVFSAGDVLTASNSVRPTDGNGNFQWQVTDVTHDDFGLASYKIFANLQFDAPQKAYGLTEDTVFATWKLLTLTGWGTTNGTYFLKDETATGNSRVWRRRNGTYEIKYANGSWIVFNFTNSTITATQTTAASDPWGGAWSNNIVAAKGKKYYTTDGTTYTEATVTDGDAVTANTYYEPNPHNDRVNYGSNDYEGSPLDQMLNSDGNAGTFLQPNTIWSNNPSWASSEAGFKKGFDPDFLAAVKETNIVLNLNTVTAGGGQKTLIRKFFLLSSTEVGLASGEGEVLDFYNEVEETARIKYNLSGGAQHWWLRSPHVGYSGYVYGVTSSGTLNYYNAYLANGCVPACRIG